MEDQLSHEALDDLDVNALLVETGHAAIFAEMTKAMKSKTTRGDRADAAMTVNDKYTNAEAEAAYAWGDAQLKLAMAAFPKRLAIEEHKQVLLAIRLKWVRPLRFLGGVVRFIARQASKKPEDAHWRRWRQESNRAIKARSPARKAWLAGNKAKQAEYNKKASAKRKAQRAAAKAAKAGAL